MEGPKMLQNANFKSKIVEFESSRTYMQPNRNLRD